jgi:RimJ/RimL family protein N-acetyltransferase
MALRPTGLPLPMSGHFVREGTLREDCVVNGEVSDSWVYGLIKREWQVQHRGS